MKTFSKWVDNSGKSYDQIISQMDNYDEWAPKEKDELTKEILRYEIIKEIESQDIILKSKKSKFAKYRFEYEKTKKHSKNELDRSKRVAPPVNVEVVI